jgi:hypothetical protein
MEDAIMKTRKMRNLEVSAIGYGCMDKDISKQVYHEIQSDNLFSIASEPTNIKEYIDEVLREAWRMQQRN